MYCMEQRILDRIRINNNGCWIWQLQLHPKGYGKCKVNGKSIWAHRLSYETFVGEIPKGLTIDHLCEVKRCVNPYHLEAVTSEVNIERFQMGDRMSNPNFKCGHSRFGETRGIVGYSIVGKLEPRRKSSYGCRVCKREYMKKYLREWRKRNAAANSLY